MTKTQKCMTDMDLIKALWPLNRVHNHDDFDQAIKILADHIQDNPDQFRGTVKVHEYASDTEYNGWIVPKKWIPRSCSLKRTNGEEIINQDAHPLVLTPYSDAFKGRLSREELFKHLHFREDLPNAIPYVFRKQYRHWEKGWGIALPFEIAQTLEDPEYDVEIDAEFAPGTIKLLEYTVPGKRDESIVLCGHLDHPGQCNDSLSGVVASLEVMRELEARREELQYTYKVIICVEISGSAIYLDQNRELAAKMVASLCPNMLGHEAPLALCLSKASSSPLDRAMEYALKRSSHDFVAGNFHKYPDCGDEISFDAPGFDIPTTTLSRIGEQYRYYHTSLDTPDKVDSERFRQAVLVMTKALEIVDQDYVPKRTFVGNPCLGNPNINLYLEPRNISNLYNKASETQGFENIQDPSKALDPRLFMEFFLSNLEGKCSVLDLALDFGIPFEFAKAYADEFQTKKLIEQHPVTFWKDGYTKGNERRTSGVSTEDSGVLF